MNEEELKQSLMSLCVAVDDALDMAIKALEQEPCEDCISREVVRDTIFAECSGTKLDIDFAKVLLLQRAIKALPSVTPTRKKGKWIAKSFHELYCNNCKFDFDIMTNEFIDKMKYCPNCGSKMEVEDDSN